jgi:transposase
MSDTIQLRNDFNAAKLLEAARLISAAGSNSVLALEALYSGLSLSQAAKIAKVETGTVRKWVAAFNEDGVSVLAGFRGGQNYELRTGITAEQVRRAADLSGSGGRRAYLLAIASMYDGVPTREISRISRVSETTLREWREDFNHQGYRQIDRLESDYRPKKLSATRKNSIEWLVELASSTHGDHRRRLQVIIESYAALDVEEIAEKTGQSRAEVTAWIKVYNAVGARGLSDQEYRRAAKTGASAPVAPIALPTGFTAQRMREIAASVPKYPYRRSLDAIAMLYAGSSVDDAAMALGVGVGTIMNNLRRLAAEGEGAFVRPAKQAPSPLDPDILVDDIEREAAARTDPRQALQLKRLAEVYRGRSVGEVARDHGVTEETIVSQLRALSRFGFDHFADKYGTRLVPDKPRKSIVRVVQRKAAAPTPPPKPSEPSKYENESVRKSMTPAARPSGCERMEITRLRQLADTAMDPTQARRFRILLDVVECGDLREAAIRAGMRPAELRQLVEAFNAGGPEALLSARSSLRPFRPFLSERAARLLKAMSEDGAAPQKAMASAAIRMALGEYPPDVARSINVPLDAVKLWIVTIDLRLHNYEVEGLKRQIDEAGFDAGKLAAAAKVAPAAYKKKLAITALIAEGHDVADLIDLSKTSPLLFAPMANEVVRLWTPERVDDLLAKAQSLATSAPRRHA